MSRTVILIVVGFLSSVAVAQTPMVSESLRLNDLGYYERRGFEVMMFSDFYPEGHQGGVTILQAGVRVAANGDVRLNPTPGQWSPIPVVRSRIVDSSRQTVSVTLSYPDSTRDRKGFNPIIYPDLRFSYTVRSHPEGSGIHISVDLESPLPPDWGGKVGFNLELFPGQYFGEHYMMDRKSGLFPRQANGPTVRDSTGELQALPMAAGQRLIVSPGEVNRELSIESEKSNIQLFDGRDLYNNGWFIVRSTIPAGVTKGAVEWYITGRVDSSWTSPPVIQVSQVGYRPRQPKFAVIELDRNVHSYLPIDLLRVDEQGEHVVRTESAPKPWGTFLRYQYLKWDFSTAVAEGIYRIRYGNVESNEFEIKEDVFDRDVWQPTLEYFLPVQMCHMKVTDRYRTWHGLCHMDDATMAPLNHNHFDGYYQHESTLTTFKPGEHIPGVNVGGWHDAGDYDIRVESQAETVYKLALAYEMWHVGFDETTIDQKTHCVEIHVPDGKPDILEQVEHGVLSIVGAYESMGRLYRGIIAPTLKQYVLLGDATNMTDNIVYKGGETDPVLHRPLPNDDRLLFTEVNPMHELLTAQALAAASRVLGPLDPGLAAKCLRVSHELWARDSSRKSAAFINATAELYLTTEGKEYEKILRVNDSVLVAHPERCALVLGRVMAKLNDPRLTSRLQEAVRRVYARAVKEERENPFGVPYRPRIWGAGWEIQAFGVNQLFLHLAFPTIVPVDYAFNALNFVLGCHPGMNTASFASGVGVRSMTVAYGANRDDWSYIPGGIASGTALIRPDFPELKRWPYLWQQGEYVLGGGTADFVLLALAAGRLR